MKRSNKPRTPFHRLTNPDGGISQRAGQMQINRDCELRSRLAGTVPGLVYLNKLATLFEEFADEKVDVGDDLQWFCLHHPRPFGTRVRVLEELAKPLFWWMRMNRLAGIADGLEDDLRNIASIAQRLDSSKPIATEKQQRLFARHVPLNCDLRQFAERLRGTDADAELEAAWSCVKKHLPEDPAPAMDNSAATFVESQAKGTIAGSEDADKPILIDLSKWSKSNARNLMQDLIEDDLRAGVRVKIRRHGSNGMKELKRSLRNTHDLSQIADAIVRIPRQTGTYKLNIPPCKITYKSPRT